MLDRPCRGESTSGCRYLYSSLIPPYGTRHLEAVRRGLGGSSADAARTAAELVRESPLDNVLAEELRASFDEWWTKEEPYPRGSGVIPESLRDELAKVLVAAFTQDHGFLQALLTDERPEVRSAARDHFLAEAAGSALLRSNLLKETLANVLRPELLRAAVSKGLYRDEEAIAAARLLHSEDPRLRYASLSILDVNYLEPHQVRDESYRLLSDKELDIREGVNRAIRTLGSSGFESYKM